jgi:hypothetical protein
VSEAPSVHGVCTVHNAVVSHCRDAVMRASCHIANQLQIPNLFCTFLTIFFVCFSVPDTAIQNLCSSFPRTRSNGRNLMKLYMMIVIIVHVHSHLGLLSMHAAPEKIAHLAICPRLRGCRAATATTWTMNTSRKECACAILNRPAANRARL